MLSETGRIVAVEDDALWVETIAQSTCGSCAAKKGCGQSLLSRFGARANYLRVLLDGRNAQHYRVNESVNIGIPEDVIVKGSLFVYLLPLLFMLVFAGIGHHYFEKEWVSILASLAGLAIGGGVVKLHALYHRNNPKMQPVLLEPISTYLD